MDQSKNSRSLGLFVGSTRVFEKAGFQRMAERKSGRPFVRLVLREDPNAGVESGSG
jgi:ABC-type ATPase with predicted acetyltransferase domain